MAKLIESPMDNVASPPAGNKGGPGVYNGENQGPFKSFKRTGSKDGVPEKIYDGEIPSGNKSVIDADKLPKHMK